MKKRTLLVVVLSLLVLSLATFTACEFNSPKQDYDAPQISAGEEGLSVSMEGISAFEYRADGGEWTAYEGTIAFDETVGQHTVTARVKADDAKTAAEATYSYETKAVSLSDIAVEGAVANWTAEAKCVYLKVDDGEFAPVSANAYTAGQTASVTVKAEGGWDAAAKVFYAGEPVTKQATVTVVIPALDAPVLFVRDGQIVWDAVEGATKYMAKVGDGAFEDATAVALSTEPGSYTVTVKAIGDEHHLDSDEATFTYTVKQATLSWEKTAADSVRLDAFEGMALLLDAGAGYRDIADLGITALPYTYTATASHTAKAKVAGGYSEADRVLYLESEYSISLVVASADDLVIEDATDKVAADLTDEWTVKKYDNSWIDTGASITVADSYSGMGNCAVFNCWNNYSVFRYGKAYTAANGFNAISFDVKGDGTTKLRVQLMDSATGVYVTYSLGGAGKGETLPAYWQHVVISMADGDWTLNFGGQSLTFEQAKAYVGMMDESEIIPYFDTINFIVYGESANGNSTKVYLDNVTFEKNVAATSRTQILCDVTDKYVAVNTVDDQPVGLQLTLTSATEGVLATVNLSSNISVEVTVEIDPQTGLLTLKDKLYAGAGLTVKATVRANGAAFTVTEVTGGADESQKAVVRGAVFHAGSYANTLLDFESLTLGTDYTANDWTAYVYTTAWGKASGVQMRVRSNDGTNKLVNFATDTNTRKYVYNETGAPLGLANWFSLDLGNYFDGAVTMQIKVAVVDTAGNTHYLLGSSDAFYEFSVTSKTLVTFSKYLTTPINVQSVYIVTKSTASGKYLYGDNLKVAYAFSDPTAEQPKPYEGTSVLELDFSDGTTGSAYTSSMWTQYKYTTEWVAMSGSQMNSREKNGSKAVNFVGGYSTSRKFIFNENGPAIGYADYFGIDLGNDFSGASTIKFKVVLVDTDGGLHYVFGSSDSWEEIAGGTAMTHYEKTFAEVNVKSFYIVVYSAANGNAYLYADNITLKTERSTAAGYRATVQEQTATFDLLEGNANGVLACEALGLNLAMSIQFTSQTEFVAKDTATAGACVALTGTLAADGSITVTSAEGSFAYVAALVGAVFSPVA